MEKLIKTENIDDFINEYFIVIFGGRLSKIKERVSELIGFNSPIGSIAPPTAEERLKDKILISNESGLKEGDLLEFEKDGWLNNRCKITHHYVYAIKKHDSVSVKGILEQYFIVPTYNK